ncbi:TPA: cell division protein FtsZ [Candidatus Woesearchaeota archaeon]|nr:cell division protein FtsZ [Candidatus Woesearchaeota archaeon]
MFDDILAAAKGSSADSSSKIEPVNEEDGHVRIAVIGVGGAGCNCVDRLTKIGIKSATTIGLNTDAKHINMIQAHKKILIGKTITRGLGAGGYADIARKAAEADREMLKREIGENELVFLVAGMGGGTGGGAAPVVAEIAKEQGAIVVSIVTYPFALERVRIKNAQVQIKNLVQKSDTVVVIDNNRLASYVPNLPIDKAFELADSITSRAVIGIADTIMFPSLLNVDFADVRAVMQGGGLAMISLGEGTGMDRVQNVVKDTLEHPLLDVNYEGAKGCMLHIEGGPDLTLGDAIKTGETLTQSFDPTSGIKVGARVNPNMRETIRVTAIITGVRSPYIFKKDDDSSGLDLAATSSSSGDSALQYL